MGGWGEFSRRVQEGNGTVTPTEATAWLDALAADAAQHGVATVTRAHAGLAEVVQMLLADSRLLAERGVCASMVRLLLTFHRHGGGRVRKWAAGVLRRATVMRGCQTSSSNNSNSSSSINNSSTSNASTSTHAAAATITTTTTTTTATTPWLAQHVSGRAEQVEMVQGGHDAARWQESLLHALMLRRLHADDMGSTASLAAAAEMCAAVAPRIPMLEPEHQLARTWRALVCRVVQCIWARTQGKQGDDADGDPMWLDVGPADEDDPEYGDSSAEAFVPEDFAAMLAGDLLATLPTQAKVQWLQCHADALPREVNAVLAWLSAPARLVPLLVALVQLDGHAALGSDHGHHHHHNNNNNNNNNSRACGAPWLIEQVCLLTRSSNGNGNSHGNSNSHGGNGNGKTAGHTGGEGGLPHAFHTLVHAVGFHPQAEHTHTPAVPWLYMQIQGMLTDRCRMPRGDPAAWLLLRVLHGAARAALPTGGSATCLFAPHVAALVNELEMATTLVSQGGTNAPAATMPPPPVALLPLLEHDTDGNDRSGGQHVDSSGGRDHPRLEMDIRRSYLAVVLSMYPQVTGHAMRAVWGAQVPPRKKDAKGRKGRHKEEVAAKEKMGNNDKEKVEVGEQQKKHTSAWMAFLRVLWGGNGHDASSFAQALETVARAPISSTEMRRGMLLAPGMYAAAVRWRHHADDAQRKAILLAAAEVDVAGKDEYKGGSGPGSGLDAILGLWRSACLLGMEGNAEVVQAMGARCARCGSINAAMRRGICAVMMRGGGGMDGAAGEVPRQRCLVVAVAGCSSSGKSTLAKALAKAGTHGPVHLLQMDDYYVDDAAMPKHAGFDDWDSEHAIDWPRFHCAFHHAVATVPAGETLVVEGFLAALPGLAHLFDLKVLLSLDWATCRARRFARDEWVRDHPDYFDKVVWPHHEEHRAASNWTRAAEGPPVGANMNATANATATEAEAEAGGVVDVAAAEDVLVVDARQSQDAVLHTTLAWLQSQSQ